MKKLLFAILIFTSLQSMAQFKSASLQAAGLTCAMCSKAINKSLEKLNFVESVQADIKSSTFLIVFKQGVPADFDALKTAVQDAGFSVAKLKVTANLKDLQVQNDTHVKIEGKNFHFINASSQVLNGEKTFTLADKDFVGVKEFKKIAAGAHMSCVQTGRAAACCSKAGMEANERVYHVTI